MTSRRHTTQDDSESDDEIRQIQCWIPGDGIDVEVLNTYLKEFIDGVPTIRASRNPQDREKTGYTISAVNTLNVAGLRDVIKDSKSWGSEQKGGEYRKNPYYYYESDTWEKRKAIGATPGFKNPRPQRRRPAEQRNTNTSESTLPKPTRHTEANAPSGNTAPRRDPSPPRGPRPGGPNPNSYSSTNIYSSSAPYSTTVTNPSTGLEGTMKNLYVDETKANSKTKVQPGARHQTGGDDSKPTGKGGNQPSKSGRHDEREKSYSYH